MKRSQRRRKSPKRKSGPGNLKKRKKSSSYFLPVVEDTGNTELGDEFNGRRKGEEEREDKG